MHRFPYRYRLARSFESINAENLGRTKAGYDAGMKVFLAYTAYEEIHEAARVVTNNRVLTKINTIRSNPSIATKIRSNERLKNLLLTHTDDNALKNNLTKFYKQNTNDIMALACAIRNIYAHGEFTAGGAGLVTIEDCKQMRSIADELLNYCDELFTNCADELERIANER